MATKVSIQLTIPIRIKRIANGERIIEQTGPDEIAAEIHEGDVQNESPLGALHKLLDEYEKERRKVRARGRRAKITAVPSFSNGGSKSVKDGHLGKGHEGNKSPKVEDSAF